MRLLLIGDDPMVGRAMRQGLSGAARPSTGCAMLSVRKFSVVEVLTRRDGAVDSRDRLDESLYAVGVEEIGSNAIEVHLHNLRRNLGAELIRNVRGVGYRIAAAGAVVRGDHDVDGAGDAHVGHWQRARRPASAALQRSLKACAALPLECRPLQNRR